MQSKGGTCTFIDSYAPSINASVPTKSCVGDGSNIKGVMFESGANVDIWTFSSLNEGNNNLN